MDTGTKEPLVMSPARVPVPKGPLIQWPGRCVREWVPARSPAPEGNAHHGPRDGRGLSRDEWHGARPSGQRPARRRLVLAGHPPPLVQRRAPPASAEAAACSQARSSEIFWKLGAAHARYEILLVLGASRIGVEGCSPSPPAHRVDADHAGDQGVAAGAAQGWGGDALTGQHIGAVRATVRVGHGRLGCPVVGPKRTSQGPVAHFGF